MNYPPSKEAVPVVVGTRATSRKGWIRERCSFPAFLCNRNPQQGQWRLIIGGLCFLFAFPQTVWAAGRRPGFTIECFLLIWKRRFPDEEVTVQ